MSTSASGFDGDLIMLVLGLFFIGGGTWALMEVVQGTFGLDLVRAFGAAIVISGVIFAVIAWIVRRLWS